MKNGSIFDANISEEFAQWREEHYKALADTVITAFCATANDMDPAAVIAHGFLKDLLLASGYTEEGLQLWEFLSQGKTDHES